ncbi:MAG: ATP-binding protein [Alphaproteobacteria bacterium]
MTDWNTLIFELEIAAFFICVTLLYFLHKTNRRTQETRQVLSEILDNLGYGMLSFDARGYCYAVNAQARKSFPDLCGKSATISGLSFQKALDFLYDNAVECDDNHKRAAHIVAANFMEQEAGFREIVRDANGALCLVLASKTSADHKILMVIDIAEQHAVQESYVHIGHENYQLSKIIEASQIGVVVMERITDRRAPTTENLLQPNSQPQNTYHILFSNSVAETMLGMKTEAMRGRDLRALLSLFEERPRFREFEKSMDAGEIYEAVLSRRDEEGGHFWYALHLAPLENDRSDNERNNNRNRQSFICVFRDITTLKMRDARFFQAKKLEALGQLSAGIAHDFNNILSIIEGYSVLAERQFVGAENAGAENAGAENAGASPKNAAKTARINQQKIASYLQKIQIATQRGAALTKRMLTFSRHKIQEETLLDIGKIIAEQSEILSAVSDKDIFIEFQLCENALPVKCSQDAVYQILLNLIINARDAIDHDGGIIHVRLDEVLHVDIQDKIPEIFQAEDMPERYAVICVLDNGCGMGEDIKSEIFNPFFTTKEEGRGTGLGLSVVYGLVSDMQGFIEVETAIGTGTTFTVYLPLAAREASGILSKNAANTAADSAASVLNPSGSLSGYTVMVVDDEAALLDVMEHLIAGAGAQVITARNGYDALLVQDDFAGNIDVLVTDIMMPEMSGAKLAELFLSLRPQTQVVFLSGYPSIQEKRNIRIPENALFLSKPVDFERFIRLLEIIVKTPQAQKALVQAEFDSLPKQWVTGR